tara:strand:- start:2174 stop:2731 length:558 start_codon:yes stop_codon:yes gene_type:complete
MKPILFYSKKCNNSIELWKYLQSKNMLNGFIKICTDNNNKIPSTIRATPAVLVKDRAPIFNQAIYLYLNSFSASPTLAGPDGSKKVDFTKPAEINRPLDKKPQIKTSTNGLENILDYNPVEMGSSMSDSYSFIQNNPEPLDFCFQFIENTPNSSPEQRMPMKKTNNNLDDRLQQLQAARGQLNRK